MTAISRHGAFERMTRHRHSQGYVALVLAGGYIEAGDRGRLRVEAGQAPIARLAERDLGQAAELLRQTFHPSAARLNDWPDLLAASLATEPDRSLAEWAETMGIAPQSLSRGFRRAYGTSPKRYRLELRAIRALRRLPGWQGSLATLAAETGFADQAHLTRAIVALTGQTPNRLKG